jgi:hypothetical protein
MIRPHFFSDQTPLTSGHEAFCRFVYRTEHNLVYVSGYLCARLGSIGRWTQGFDAPADERLVARRGLMAGTIPAPMRWRIRRADIPENERDIFDRYGEAVISTIVAGGFIPDAQDLRNLFSGPVVPSQETNEHARDWLTERGDLNERRVIRDFVLEIIIIALIGIEIGLGVWGLREGGQQAKVLNDMNTNTAATVKAVGELRKAQEQALTEQTKSLASLEQMNTALQSSVRETAQMLEAAQKQLQILQAEQAARLAELAKKPNLQLYVGASVLKPVGATESAKPKQITSTLASFDITLRNGGNASATKGVLRIIAFDKDVRVSSSAPSQGVYEPDANSPHTLLVPFELLRPNVQIPMSITANYPAGQQPFIITFNVDADEVPTATPLGVIAVNPPKE